MQRSKRTLRNWRVLAKVFDEGHYRPPGRPRATHEACCVARERVRAVLDRAGYQAGERAVHQALGGSVPLALVRRALRELKAEHRAHVRRMDESRRVHVVLHGRNVLWSVDATHLGRDTGGATVAAELVREAASTTSLSVSIGPSPNACEVAYLLDRSLDVTGEPPLVLASDNGSENKDEVDDWCTQHGVVRLWNLPHTPKHNPWVEHGNGELKAESGLGKGVVIDCLEDATCALVCAIERLDGHRPRATRGGLTAWQAYRALPPAESLVDRATFLDAVACALQEPVPGCNSWRARRLAEREAVLRTMERFELITRTRGCASRATKKPEGVL
jgi:hypothetical protein